MSALGRAAWAAVHELEAVQTVHGYSTTTQRTIDDLRRALDAEAKAEHEAWRRSVGLGVPAERPTWEVVNG